MKHYKSYAYKTFLTSYIYFIIISIVACSVTYYTIYKIADENNEKLFNAMLGNANNITTQYTSTIENTAQLISQNLDSTMFLSRDIFSQSSPDYNPVSYERLRAVLNTYNQNKLLDEICLYSHINNKMLTTESLYTPTKMPPSFINFNNMTFDEFKNDYLSKKSYNKLYTEMEITIGGEKKNRIMAMTSFPLFDNKVTGTLLILLDKEKLLNSIQESFNLEESYIYFYHKDILLAKSDTAPDLIEIPTTVKSNQKINNTNYILYTSKNENNYSFVITTPENVAMRSLHKFRIMIAVTLVGSFILYLLIAICLSRYNVKPLYKVLSKFTDLTANNSTNEYNIIAESIDNLIDSKQILQTEYNKNLPVLISNFLHMLFSGQMTNNEQIEAMSQKLNLTLPYDYHIILIISLVDISTLNIENIKKIMDSKELLHYYLNKSLTYESCDISVTDIATLIKCNNESIDDDILLIENLINNISKILNEKYTINLKAALGDVFYGIENIFFNYESVMDIFFNGLHTTYNNTIWCTQSPNIQSNYYYPFELEQKLIYSFRQDDRDQIFNILDNIESKNTNQRILLNNSTYCLNYNLKGTIYKILNFEKIRQNETILEFLSQLDEQKPLKHFFEIYKNLLDYMLKIKTNIESDSDLANTFLHFVEESYHDPNFCRQSFAEKFNITEDYTSRIFKEYTGYQFHDYVTKLRIERSTIMLLEGNHSIERIALSVGYNSAVAFRRAFKSYIGMTPKEFKQSYIKS